MRAALSDQIIRSLEPPSRGTTTAWDTKVQGLGVRVSSVGSKTFVVRYSVDGRERQASLGPLPLLSLSVAREQASKIRAAALLGKDILAERAERRAAREAAAKEPDMDALQSLYLDRHVELRRTAKGQANERRYWRAILSHIPAKTKVRAVMRNDVVALHREISTRGRVTANRTVVSLRTAMNMAVREGWRSDNPCASFPLHPEAPRHRYLTTDEAERLFKVLDRWQDRREASLLLVLLHTGARRGELAKADWSEIDFDRARWNKPSGHTKARRFHAVPLNGSALDAFRLLRTLTNASKVIGATTKDPTGIIDRAWKKVREAAALGDVRLHDLRHSFASFLADVGESLPTIGALLGHSSPATTNRYVHLTDAAMRSAVGKIDRNRSCT